MKNLLKAGVHLGHSVKLCNSKMLPYIFAEKNGIHIFDLRQTIIILSEVCRFLQNESKKNILFIGTTPSISEIIKEEAINCNAFYIHSKWLGGTLTNWKIIKNQLKKIIILEKQNILKKNIGYAQKKFKQMQFYFNGIKKMKSLPDILIIIGQSIELKAIKEAKLLKIPIISIIDSNCNPTLIDIGIPGNDDLPSSVKLILHKLSQIIKFSRFCK